MDNYVINRRSYEAQKLVEENPPLLNNPNKARVYDIACPANCKHQGRIEYSRWRAMPLPVSAEMANWRTKVEIRPDVFAYDPVEGKAVVEWYLNFVWP